MRPLPALVASVAVVAMLAHAPAYAQAPEATKPVLHVNDAFRECFFDLHPELTKSEFKEFAGDLGSILRFRQIGDARTLGRGVFELSVEYTRNPVDEAKGAWNNTMSHPAADHYLGRAIAFPRVVARYGVSRRVDLGAWGTIAPHSNYGVVGIDTKIALLMQGPGMPVSVSIRPSISSLVGPSELWAGNASIDVSVGRAFGLVSPYVGFVSTGSLAVERSGEVDLKPAAADQSLTYAGISFNLRRLVLSAEVEKGRLVRYGVSVATRF